MKKKQYTLLSLFTGEEHCKRIKIIKELLKIVVGSITIMINLVKNKSWFGGMAHNTFPQARVARAKRLVYKLELLL